MRVLAQVFRGKLLGLLEKAVNRAKIPEAPDEDFRRQLEQAARRQWGVYSKPPFAGAEQVLAYLGRYAYRIALSNDRLVAASFDAPFSPIALARDDTKKPLHSRTLASRLPPAQYVHERLGGAGG